MKCAICGAGAQSVVHGYSVCSLHSDSLRSAILLGDSPAEWFRMHWRNFRGI